MACNCASNEQIKELYRRYGEKKSSPRTTKQKIKYALQYTGVAIAMIFVVPFLILYVLYKGLMDDNHQISLTKFFRLDKLKTQNG